MMVLMVSAIILLSIMCLIQLTNGKCRTKRTDALCLNALLGDQGQDLGKLEDQVGLGELWKSVLAFKEGIFIKHGFIFIPATYESNLKNNNNNNRNPNVLGTGESCLSPLQLWFPTETAKQSRDQYLQMVLPQPSFLPEYVNCSLEKTDGHRLQDPAYQRETVFENF